MTAVLASRVCVVTGAASGIGRAVALAYAQAGGVVHALDRDAAVHNLQTPIISHLVDLADPDAVAACFADIQARGPVDVLVNNAGIIFFKPIEEVSVADWDRLMDVNLRGAFLCTRAVAAGMKARKRGAIINVSSNAGVQGGDNESTYCASKFGIEGFSRALAIEFAPSNVSVNTITPGHPVHTAMSEVTYGAAQRTVWKDPAELSPAFVHLALQDASGITDRYIRAWDMVQELEAATCAS